MSFPRYPKYKPSGVEWFGDVPEHWSRSAIKRVFHIVGGGTPASDSPEYWDGDVPWATPADLGKQAGFDLAATLRTITALGRDSCNTAMVPIGSVVLSTRAPIGSIGIAAVPLCTNQGCKSLVPRRGAHPRYFAYVLCASTAALQLRGKGTTFAELSAEALGTFPLALPPLLEQRAIAAFLDRETAKIDALVDKQQRLIELLKEKRQAVISHAVTKGLDPTVPMKPSGVEWLGDVPAHWEVKPLRHLRCAVHTGPFGSQLHADEYIEGGIPVVNPINLVEGGILPTDSVTVSEQTARRLSHQRLRVGDIVFARRGELGRCAQVTNQEVGWLCGTGSMVLRLDDVGVETSYFARYLAIPAARHYFTLHCIGSVMPSLNTSTLLGLAIPLPPVEEQRRIDAACTELLGRLDRLVVEAESAITLLQERRSALISAAVTGQIDVRNTVTVEAA